MGTDSLFWTQSRDLFEVKQPDKQHKHVYAVDGSVLMYNVSRRGLGFDTFVIDPGDTHAVDELAIRWANELEAELRALFSANVQKNAIRWFFEGRVTKLDMQS